MASALPASLATRLQAASGPCCKASASPASIWRRRSRERLECSTPTMASTSEAAGSPPPPSCNSSSSPGFDNFSNNRVAARIAAVVACLASLTLPSAKRSWAAAFAAWIADHTGGTSGAPARSSIQASARAPASTSSTAPATSSTPPAAATSAGLKRPSAVSTRRSPPVRLTSTARPCAAASCAAASEPMAPSSAEPRSFFTISRFERSSMYCAAAARTTPPALAMAAPACGTSSSLSSHSTSSSSSKARNEGTGPRPNHSCQPSSGQPKFSSALTFGFRLCLYKVLPIL
mmetsp:Transcript_117843/g.340645  ORF Transcript_117843/g.340645 Transcript_117843/m.340645 type:complete len:290 (+) Transcript_117843:823-1692(+)